MAFDPASALAASPVRACCCMAAPISRSCRLDDVQPLIDAPRSRAGSGEAMIAAGVSHNLKTVTGPNDPGFTVLAPAIADKLAAWLAHWVLDRVHGCRLIALVGGSIIASHVTELGRKRHDGDGAPGIAFGGRGDFRRRSAAPGDPEFAAILRPGPIIR